MIKEIEMGGGFGNCCGFGADSPVQMAENEVAKEKRKNRLCRIDRFGRNSRCFARFRSGHAGAYAVHGYPVQTAGQHARKMNLGKERIRRMIEKGKISAFQLGKMIYLAITPTAILTAPGITYKFARQDLWLSPIWAFSGLIAVFAALRLHRLYPGQNIVQACERILGRFPGKIIGGAYWLFYLS
ncbi:GerAB/ArcD/ProY family transporter [Paenibacillus cisolokensis]|uniref:GerAB/ArcD/ProY family transporter n=1 Tax=Paenibacillus cisolokensis TaxID=1658519 RepID=UPI003D28B877